MKLQCFDRLIILCSARNGYLKGDIRSERDIQEPVTGLSQLIGDGPILLPLVSVKILTVTSGMQ